MQLPPDLKTAGDELLHLETVDSTMEEARRRFDAGPARRLWIVADRQEAGRGRSGRNWVSPSGNLHMTLLAPVRIALRDQPKLGFAAGLALAETAADLLPYEADVRLKWPNDLLLRGAKAGGILLEGHGGGTWIAIGIGVNVTSHPPDLPYGATHLRAFDASLDRDRLFEHLARNLVAWIDAFAARGFGPIRQSWLTRAAHFRHDVKVWVGQRPLFGRFVDLDGDGRLVLETADGSRPIDAGDVFPLDNASGGGQGPEIAA